MKILVTGGAGFIGSAVVRQGIHEGHIIKNIDKLTYAACVENLNSICDHPSYSFEEIDICNGSALKKCFNKFMPDAVMHLAAESHVDRSIDAPSAFIQSNIIGTYELLEASRNYWIKQGQPIDFRFHHISTDEVYGTLGETGLFTEETPYAPNSPYSASKASSDFMVRSYFHTYGMNVVTTNCSNNYGEKQHDEKLIPTIIRKAVSGEKIPIYGDGKNIRDWLYVLDHCKGIELVFTSGKSGETYNIGGKNERNNLYIAHTICAILDEIIPKTTSYKEQIRFVKDRPGHDYRYAIDATKLEQELGWRAAENFESGIRKTIQWYLSKYT
jgi:dTDP-glucose 4,6-dehydratase